MTTPSLRCSWRPFRTLGRRTPHPLKLLQAFYLNSLGNPLPRKRAHSCNFCVFFSRLFSTSILIPGHRIAHLGITYSESFCNQHWGSCLQKRVYAGVGVGWADRELRTTRGAARRLSARQRSYPLTSLPWPAAPPASLRSLPAALGRVLVVQKVGAWS